MCRSTVVSSALEVTPSLVNTLWRWYSTVRRLRNSLAAMSGLLAPRAGEQRDSHLLRRELVEDIRVAPARGLAASPELGTSAFGPGRGPELLEDLQRIAEVGASLAAPALPAQGLAQRQLVTGALERSLRGVIVPQRCGEVIHRGIGVGEQAFASCQCGRRNRQSAPG